jgi:L-ribulokinase
MTADPRSPDACVIGVDFGTLSGRAVVTRGADGAELGASELLHRLRAVRDRAVRERVGDGRAGQARAEGGRS